MKCIRLASHPKDPITQVLDIAQCDGDKTELSGDRTWGLIDEHIGAGRLSVLWSQKSFMSPDVALVRTGSSETCSHLSSNGQILRT